MGAKARFVLGCMFMMFLLCGSECKQVCMQSGCDVALLCVCSTMMMPDNGMGPAQAAVTLPLIIVNLTLTLKTKSKPVLTA